MQRWVVADAPEVYLLVSMLATGSGCFAVVGAEKGVCFVFEECAVAAVTAAGAFVVCVVRNVRLPVGLPRGSALCWNGLIFRPIAPC